MPTYTGRKRECSSPGWPVWFAIQKLIAIIFQCRKISTAVGLLPESLHRWWEGNTWIYWGCTGRTASKRCWRDWSGWRMVQAGAWIQCWHCKLVRFHWVSVTLQTGKGELEMPFLEGKTKSGTNCLIMYAAAANESGRSSSFRFPSAKQKKPTEILRDIDHCVYVQVGYRLFAKLTASKHCSWSRDWKTAQRSALARAS